MNYNQNIIVICHISSNPRGARPYDGASSTAGRSHAATYRAQRLRRLRADAMRHPHGPCGGWRGGQERSALATYVTYLGRSQGNLQLDLATLKADLEPV